MTTPPDLPPDAVTGTSRERDTKPGGLACFLCGGTAWDVLGQVIPQPGLLAVRCRGCGVAGPHDLFTTAKPSQVSP
jgi:hypothetical protein